VQIKVRKDPGKILLVDITNHFRQETPVSPIMKKLENEGYIQPLPNGEVRYTRKSESQTATSSQSSGHQSRGGNDYFSSVYGGGHGYQEKSPEDEAYERYVK
jgi:hypothetical protein